MKITLNGYYGFSNYGDELFNLASVLGARRWWPDHPLDILGAPVHGIDAKFRVPAWFPPALYTAPHFGGKMSRLAYLAAALLTRDLIVYAGGSTLSYSSILKKIQRIAAERSWTKFAAIGVSIGPFADAADQEEAARFLRRFTFISVRDKQSIALLEEMKVPLTPLFARDLVGALPLLLPANDQKQKAAKTLGVSVCNYESYTGGDAAQEQRRNEALFEGISRHAKREGTLVRIFCLNTNPRWGDMALSRQLQAYLRERGTESEIISCQNNLIGTWHGLASCAAVLCVRLHAGITAYLTHVPFALAEYHRKCTDYLDDIGQPASLRIPANLTDPARVDEVINELFRGEAKPTLAPETYSAEAARNFTEVPWAKASSSASPP
jgi:polysaccharide pyruvyl transferase WcaK-like protein